MQSDGRVPIICRVTVHKPVCYHFVSARTSLQAPARSLAMHVIDAPLGLANILTVLSALACLWTVSPEQRGAAMRTSALAVPGAFAAIVALMLLAGVFEATLAHDAEWVAALLLGAFLGRARGWSLPVELFLPGGMVRPLARWDGMFMAAGIAAMAIVDFLNAALEQPILHPAPVAAAAAFCAGFLACRALAILVRHTRMTEAGSR
jgi:hypothetical protein